MTEVAPEVAPVPPTIEDLQAEIVALRAAQTPKAPKTSSKFSVEVKKILQGIRAAFTSPDAVKAEKSLAALVITRLLLTVGASAATVSLAGAILHAVGVNLP